MHGHVKLSLYFALPLILPLDSLCKTDVTTHVSGRFINPNDIFNNMEREYSRRDKPAVRGKKSVKRHCL